MTALQKILDAYRDVSLTEREKGTYFEKLILCYFRNEASYKDLYSQVWLYADWAKEQGIDARDVGIDLVAKTSGTDEYHAIQCKLYAEEYRLQKKDIDSFFTASGKKTFTHRIIVSSTNNWSEHAEDALRDQQPPVSKIDLFDLENSQIDWSQYAPDTTPIIKAKKQLRPHQERALADVDEKLTLAERGKLIMACGTGKTFTSLKIAESFAGRGGRVLFLVPSLSLLSQTLTEWTQESSVPLHSFAVCSDSDVGKKRKKDDDSVQTLVHELRYPATTDAKRLAGEMARRHDANHMSVVFSTYHSIDVVSRAQNDFNLADFDIIICDEAHRTTGASFGDEDESHFQKIHDAPYVHGKKRLYMTATPRIYADAVKAKAEQDNITVCSMDDEALYGEVLHTITFSEAVAQNLLVDYKVIVLAIEEAHVSRRIQELLKDESNQLKVDDASKIVGCWKALSKQNLTHDDLLDDTNPMHRAVAFCQVIEAVQKGKKHRVSSKNIAAMFSQVVEAYRQSEIEDGKTDVPVLACEAEHVDGSMNAGQKEEKLNWLKASIPDDTCRILSNVRCLSEGVDVPALDAVLFLSPRNSQVEVVQSVGRVMRNAPGKKRGYVVLPVVIPAGMEAHEALNDNETYRVVWQVLQALRSHDDRFDAMINRLDLNGSEPRKMEVIAITDKLPTKTANKGASGLGDTGKGSFGIGEHGTSFPAHEQFRLEYEVGEIERAIYAKVVKKCGNRSHWEEWAGNIGQIARTHIDRIQGILETPANAKEKTAFAAFAAELRDDLNDSLSDDEIIEMLAQHLITKPVFDALFSDYSFAQNNPISIAMQGVLEVLQEHRLDKEADTLQKFYDSVKMRAEGINTAQGKQKIIVELYDKFFSKAFPRLKEKLGIVYTPVEVVDFIVHSVNDILKQEFGQTLGSDDVHILDPFTGTGTFVTRLLQSGLMTTDEIRNKYKTQIHANELVLLAYYIAAINIESTYHAIVGGDYVPFEGICLTDTFQMYEKEDLIDLILVDNSERRKRQKKLDIRVIMGNPPYSIGQERQNDNNQNVAYPYLDGRIEKTYAARSKAALTRGLYDSYVRAIRWASDRIGDSGVIGFVTNAGFLETVMADGMRKCLADEFSSLYIFHLRGNQRTSGDISRREGGKIFGSGSRAPIAISLLVKNTKAKKRGDIYFHDIGDYLSREEKLEKINTYGSITGISTVDGWQQIEPDEHGDWLKQRDDDFAQYIVMGDKKSSQPKLFDNYSLGIVTNRDPWCYNSSQESITTNIKNMISFFNSERLRFNNVYETLDRKEKDAKVSNFIDTNPQKISWTVNLKQELVRDTKIEFEQSSLTTSLYRPYTKQWLYFNRVLNERVLQMPRIFPSLNSKNIVILIKGNWRGDGYFSLISDRVPCLLPDGGCQCFPLYLYDAPTAVALKKQTQVSLFDTPTSKEQPDYVRRDAITDEGLRHFQSAYPGEKISKEDLFYYIYGLLHSEDYRTQYADNLSKELPRIPRVKSAEDFWAFSQAGRKLADLHLNYETVEMYSATVTGATDNPDDYRVEKMRFGKNKDKTTLHYNNKITVAGIPLEAYDYVVNGKPALDWVVERQCVKTDKDSGIVNDANDWAIETMHNPKYPLELFLRVITVSMETLKIVAALPNLEILSTESASVAEATEPVARQPESLYSGRAIAIRKILPHIIHAQPGISQTQAFQRARLATYPDACAVFLGSKAAQFQAALSQSEAAQWAFAQNDAVDRDKIWGSLQRNFGVVINSNLECSLSGDIQTPIQGIEAVIPYILEAGANYELGADALLRQDQFAKTVSRQKLMAQYAALEDAEKAVA